MWYPYEYITVASIWRGIPIAILLYITEEIKLLSLSTTASFSIIEATLTFFSISSSGIDIFKSSTISCQTFSNLLSIVFIIKSAFSFLLKLYVSGNKNPSRLYLLLGLLLIYLGNS